MARTFDALVAETILGWRRDMLWPLNFTSDAPPHERWFAPGSDSPMYDPPSVSSNDCQALHVVTAMQAKGFEVTLQTGPQGVWTCVMNRPEWARSIIFLGEPSLALAVCRTAMVAINAEE